MNTQSASILKSGIMLAGTILCLCGFGHGGGNKFPLCSGQKILGWNNLTTVDWADSGCSYNTFKADPFGYTDATEMIPSNVSGDHRPVQNWTHTANAPVTVSFYAKPVGDAIYPGIEVGDGTHGIRAYWNASGSGTFSGTLNYGTTITISSSSIVSSGGGWYFCKVSLNTNAATAYYIAPRATNTGASISWIESPGTGSCFFYGLCVVEN